MRSCPAFARPKRFRGSQPANGQYLSRSFSIMKRQQTASPGPRACHSLHTTRAAQVRVARCGCVCQQADSRWTLCQRSLVRLRGSTRSAGQLGRTAHDPSAPGVLRPRQGPDRTRAPPRTANRGHRVGHRPVPHERHRGSAALEKQGATRRVERRGPGGCRLADGWTLTLDDAVSPLFEL